MRLSAESWNSKKNVFVVLKKSVQIFEFYLKNEKLLLGAKFSKNTQLGEKKRCSLQGKVQNFAKTIWKCTATLKTLIKWLRKWALSWLQNVNEEFFKQAQLAERQRCHYFTNYKPKSIEKKSPTLLFQLSELLSCNSPSILQRQLKNSAQRVDTHAYARSQLIKMSLAEPKKKMPILAPDPFRPQGGSKFPG